jgi:hypothetical protein
LHLTQYATSAICLLSFLALCITAGQRYTPPASLLSYTVVKGSALHFEASRKIYSSLRIPLQAAGVRPHWAYCTVPEPLSSYHPSQFPYIRSIPTKNAQVEQINCAKYPKRRSSFLVN